jgi:RHS repeat-associated protein
VFFSYDTANRRSTLTLSNGVNVSYTYDNDSRVTGITYKFNANTLGNLTYSYDSLGRRTQVGGSFAGLPGAVASATYDAANELTNWNGTRISYDLNGNMLSDGSNAFSWNARNQVATLNGRNLQYDAAGRRIQNQSGTSLLYSGGNAVQELSGAAVTANLTTGAVDEAYTRTDSAGSSTPLKDGLDSTIGLVDANGNIVTSYTYDPFGNTTTAGAASMNPSQYTGRENEGNGLYYYRARYYSPVFGRFVSEDPMGFAGSGVNFYAYAGNNPISFSDPLGLSPESDQALANLHDIFKPLDDFYAAQKLAHRKDPDTGNPLSIRSAGESFGDCMANHAKDYSIVGVVDLVWGSSTGSDPGLRDTFVGGLVGGNHIMGLVGGDSEQLELLQRMI